MLDLALVGGGRQEHAELGLRVRLVLRAGRLEPERAQEERRRLLQQPDERREDVKKARTGAETASAVRSGWPSAIPFGTSSPITTCR